MADSGITKKALAEALKQLMDEMPFSKISVADICERCDMNRKSFYYHFKDKYDLLNWILNTELLHTILKDPEPNDSWMKIYRVLEYVYDNRSLVCKALAIEGQNSPAEHFYVLLEPMLTAKLQEVFGECEHQEFMVSFFCDALRCTIERWITNPNCPPPDVFLAQMRDAIRAGAKIVYKSIEESEKT